MRVAYDSSLWVEKGAFYGRAQRTDWHFAHQGLERRIPCIYRFRQGIVFDLLTLLEESKVRAYFEKYRHLEEEMSEAQCREAEAESPYREILLDKIEINGETAREISSSGLTALPFAEEDKTAASLAGRYRKTLVGHACFLCQRFQVPYPESASTAERLRRSLHCGTVRSLRLTTAASHTFYEIGVSAVLSAESPRSSLPFQNPVDGRQYTVTLERDEEFSFPPAAGQEDLFVTSAWYKIDPPLPEGQKLQFDSSIQYAARPRMDSVPEEAGCIGIIGGADGPTTVLLAGTGEDFTSGAGARQSCFSTLTMQKTPRAEFRIQGIQRTWPDSRAYSFEVRQRSK